MGQSYEEWHRELMKRFVPAVAEAERLLEEDQFDRAEAVLQAVDRDIYGACKIEDLYRRRLEALVAGGVTDENRPRVEAVYRKALYWARSAFPDPHTAMEAERYDEAREQAEAHLIRVLGYEPVPTA